MKQLVQEFDPAIDIDTITEHPENPRKGDDRAVGESLTETTDAIRTDTEEIKATSLTLGAKSVLQVAADTTIKSTDPLNKIAVTHLEVADAKLMTRCLTTELSGRTRAGCGRAVVHPIRGTTARAGPKNRPTNTAQGPNTEK